MQYVFDMLAWVSKRDGAAQVVEPFVRVDNNSQPHRRDVLEFGHVDDDTGVQFVENGLGITPLCGIEPPLQNQDTVTIRSY